MPIQYELLATQVITALRRGQRLTRPLQHRIFEFSRELMDSGEAALARVLLRVLHKVEPYEARFQWLLGLCEFHLGNFVLARRNLESHWHLTRRPQTAFVLARLCHVVGDREEMAHYLRSVPPYERYVVGNAPLFQLLQSQELGDAKSTPADFGPFINEQEESAVSRLLAKLYWRRGLSRLESEQANGAIEDFAACERFLNDSKKGEQHG